MSIIYKFKGLQIISWKQNIEQTKGTKKTNAEAFLLPLEQANLHCVHFLQTDTDWTRDAFSWEFTD